MGEGWVLRAESCRTWLCTESLRVLKRNSKVKSRAEQRAEEDQRYL